MPLWNSEEETEANCVQHVSMRLNKGHYRKCKNLIFSLYSRVVRQNLNNADHYNIKGSHYPKNVTNCTIFLFKLWQIQTSRCTLNILNILYLNHHWYKALQFSRILEDELDVRLQNGMMHSAPYQRWPNPPLEAQVQTVLAGFRALSVKTPAISNPLIIILGLKRRPKILKRKWHLILGRNFLKPLIRNGQGRSEIWKDVFCKMLRWC